MIPCITYKNGYKYQLKRDYVLRIQITPSNPIHTKYILLETTGELTIKESYAWDGPSGPTIDTQSFMRGSLIHDALYQLMRENYLDRAIYREVADRILQSLCKQDGMSSIRAWWVYQGVRWFADPAADPATERPLTYAPKKCEIDT